MRWTVLPLTVLAMAVTLATLNAPVRQLRRNSALFAKWGWNTQ